MEQPQDRPGLSLVDRLTSQKVRSLMSVPLEVEPTVPTREVVQLMRDRGVSCALVCRGEELVGIFTERDYLDSVAGSGTRLEEPIEAIMSTQLSTLSPDDSVGDLIRIVSERGFRQVPVVEGSRARGVVAALDVVKYIADLFPQEVYNLPPDPDQVMPSIEGA